MTSLVRTSNITDITCTKEIRNVPAKTFQNISIPSDENTFGCATGQCIVLSCNIPRYWKKDQEKEIDLEVKFNPTVAENQTFSVYSIASIDDQQAMALTFHLGATERLASKRYERRMKAMGVVAGIFLALSIVLAMAAILWKTKGLDKLRPYRINEGPRQMDQHYQLLPMNERDQQCLPNDDTPIRPKKSSTLTVIKVLGIMFFDIIVNLILPLVDEVSDIYYAIALFQ